MMIRRRLALVVIPFLTTLVSSRSFGKVSLDSLLELTKVTVGPFDNYQSSVDAAETVMYYTRNQNLSTQIMRIDLKSGISSPVTEVEADAKDPMISPDGSRLAFTYFRHDAKGDICLLEDKKIRCITGRRRAENSPFWIDHNRIGYVSSDDSGDGSQLMVHNLRSGSSSVITEGVVYGPAVSGDGSLLVYSNEKNHLILFDMKSGSPSRQINIDLPGVTGSAKFSVDGSFVYFPQYMVDSNRDQRLDSRDGAAIFRISLKNQRREPEQMTSLSQDCAYPMPTAKALYVSCAFEGALDIYKTQLRGVVPERWNAKDLWEAHQAARSYSDRLMLINHLQGRFGEITEAAAAERAMNDLILMQAWMPAIYYAGKLSSLDSRFAAHKILLESIVRWEALPSKEQVTELSNMVRDQRAKLDKVPESDTKLITVAYLDYFGRNEAQALNKASSLKSRDAMTMYWQTRLMRMLLSGKGEWSFERVLENRIVSVDSSEETRLYFLSRWFDRLPPGKEAEIFASDLKEKLARKDNVALVISDLIENELQLRRVVDSSDRDTIRAEMRGVVDRAKRLKDDYYATRLLFSRALVVLYRGDKTRELSTVMSLWLSYVKPESKEFPYVIEALRRNSLDVAYKFYNGPAERRALAVGAFNDSIRTTDDLEAHYQYALLQSTDAAWKELETSYASMERDGLIAPESREFVETVRKILMGRGKVTSSDLSDAVSAVESIDDRHVGVGVKYLMLGYLNHRRLLLGKDEFKYDRDFAEKAHRDYIFAIDAAWDNERIRAAAYQNLGILHAKLRNYSLAADFLQKRHELGFISDSERQSVYWIEANALYRSYRPQDAVRVTEAALSLNPSPREPFLERLAFYAWNARQFEKSVKAYEEFLRVPGVQPRSAVYLGYGYALMKMERPADSERALTKAIQLSGDEKTFKREGLQSDPAKNRFVALGLLAQLNLPYEKRADYLSERLDAFKQALENARAWYLDKRTLEAQRLKESFDLVALNVQGGKGGNANASARKLAALASTFAESHGYLNQGVFQTAKNLMLLARDGKIEKSKAIDKNLNALIKGVRDSLKRDKTPSASGRREWAEIKLIQLSYEESRSDCAQVVREKRLDDVLTSVLDSDLVRSLETDRPGSRQYLKNYGLAVFQSCI